MTKSDLQTVLEALEGADRIDTDMRDAITLLQAAIAAPKAEPVAEVDVWVELGRGIYELKQFAGFRDLPIGNHELYIHPAPKKPTYEQGYAQGFKAGMREKP